MDIETYEIHIMDKGYEHDDVEFLYNGNVVETRYVKYDAINESSRYVTHVFSKNVPKSPQIIYTTSDKKELSTFYLQLKDFGLKMFYSEKEDGYLVKKYAKRTEEKWYAVNVYIESEWLSIVLDWGYMD